MTESETEEFLNVAEEWGRFFVDRVTITPFGDAGDGFHICDVKAFLCPDHGYIEQSCGSLVRLWIFVFKLSHANSFHLIYHAKNIHGRH